EALRRAGRADEARTHAVRLLTAPPLVYGPDGLWYAVPALPTAAGPVLRAWRRWNPDAPWAEGVRLVTRGAVSRPLDPAFAGLVEDVLRTEWGRPERVYWPSAFGELARVCDRGGAADLARRCHLARHLPFDGHTGYSDDGRAGLWEAGDVFARRGRWAEAADLYAAAFRETGSPIAGYLVGDALARTGRGEGGRGLMRWAARVGPESILEGGGELARRAARAGDPDEADRLCRAFAAHGRRAEWGPQEGFYVRAELAAGRGDYALAAEAAEQARAYTLTDGFELGEPSRRLADAARIRRHRALGLLAAGDVAAAVREAEEALRLLPGDLDTPLAVVPALDKLGRAAEADGLYRRAADAHRRVLADFPAAAGHHAALARLAAGCHRELDNGLSHGRKAVELTPDDPAAVAALAEVLFARREVDEAAELARRCIDLDPADDAHRDRLVRFLGGHPVR
ncbi:MAG: tetratricopeptide repeat protein, partial [Gemmataceae bacterium]|nr:tetratricopeptide repeat protein [Gemmataceae bacterium]